MTFRQKGTSLTGVIDIQGSPCISHGTIEGTLTGSNVTFGALHAGKTVTFEGRKSGSHLAGSYDSPECGQDAGTWSATRT